MMVYIYNIHILYICIVNANKQMVTVTTVLTQNTAFHLYID